MIPPVDQKVLVVNLSEKKPIQKSPKRNFFKFLAGVGILASVAPLIPTGTFLTGKAVKTVEAPPRQKIANLRDLKPNTAHKFQYPLSDPPTPVELIDPFRAFILIRLPEDLAKDEGMECKAYSRVCVHLWCRWSYDEVSKMPACFCHGSMYDPVTGIAVCGPAALQRAPFNVLPEVKLEIDEKTDDVYAVSISGTIGLGRDTNRQPVLTGDHLDYCFK